MRADQTAGTFSDIGRKCGDVPERHNLRIVACLSDRHPAPTVTDQNDCPFRIMAPGPTDESGIKLSHCCWTRICRSLQCNYFYLVCSS